MKTSCRTVVHKSSATSASLIKRTAGHSPGLPNPRWRIRRGPVVSKTAIAVHTTGRKRKAAARNRAVEPGNVPLRMSGANTIERNTIPPIHERAAATWSVTRTMNVIDMAVTRRTAADEIATKQGRSANRRRGQETGAEGTNRFRRTRRRDASVRGAKPFDRSAPASNKAGT